MGASHYWKRKKKKKFSLPFFFQKRKKKCTKLKIPNILWLYSLWSLEFPVERHHLVSSSRHFFILDKQQSGKCLMLWLLWAGHLAPGPSCLSPQTEETEWWICRAIRSKSWLCEPQQRRVQSVNSRKTGTTLMESQCLTWQLMAYLFKEHPRPSPGGLSYISTLPWPTGSSAASAGTLLCLLPSRSAQEWTSLVDWESHGSVFVRCCFYVRC